MRDVIVEGVRFYENDLAVLRALDTPASPDEAVLRAVRLGVPRGLARGTLERLWMVGAVEKDRLKVRRSSFGTLVLEVAI